MGEGTRAAADGRGACFIASPSQTSKDKALFHVVNFFRDLVRLLQVETIQGSEILFIFSFTTDQE